MWSADPAIQRSPMRRGTLGPANAMEVGRRGFDKTRWSLVLRAGGAGHPDSRRALEELCRAYLPPLRALANRIVLDADRAEDLVQSFFAYLVDPEKKVLARADPGRGRFRSYLCKSFRNHAMNVHDHETTISSGGRVSFVDGDVDEHASKVPNAEKIYDRQWVMTLIDRAWARFEEEEQSRVGNCEVFDLFCRRLEEDRPETLRESAAALGISEAALKTSLSRMRDHLRDAVRQEVAETVERPEDVDPEMAHIYKSLFDEP
jgi:RNA polymerase sigma factor (sigma-70 family)